MNVFLKAGKIPKKKIKINIGGSKSESNRLLILQAQFPNLIIENLSDSDDTSVLKKALKIRKGDVDIHHAGTAMRFLTAYFAFQQDAEVILTGSQRMQERPIKILVDALQSLGADIKYLKKEGFPPLRIQGQSPQKTIVEINANVSSQYISALMLTASTLPNGLKIYLKGKTTSIPYIAMTLSLLKKIGISGSFKQNIITVPATKSIADIKMIVEPDWSSASYFYSLVALSENMKISLTGFLEESLQGDSALVQMYDSLGVQTVFGLSEKTISLSKKNTELPDSLMLDLSNTPDLAQTIAVTCFGLGIGCKLSGLHTLKIKETDRLLALKNELEKLGAKVQVNDNFLSLEKATTIRANIAIETYQDHRMAMAFAPLALKTDITIKNAGVVSKSYPFFWQDIQKVGVECVFVDR